MSKKQIPEPATEIETEVLCEMNPRVEAAHVIASVYGGNGDEVDAQRMLSLMILVEAFIEHGGDYAAERMGWEIDKKPATVTQLELVRSLAAATKKPQER